MRAFSIAALFLAAWVTGVAAFAALSANAARERAAEGLEAAGATLHRVVSQRVAQHDAHLTSLAALVQAQDPLPEDALRQVALAIMRFYPRILSIRVVAPDAEGGLVTVMSTADPQLPPPTFVPEVFAQKPGETRARVDAAFPNRYFLGKRTGSPGQPLAMIVEIDPALLVEPEERPGGAALALDLAGQRLVGPGDVAGGRWGDLVVTRTADSATQPLRLRLERRLALSEGIALRTLAAFGIGFFAFLFALAYALRLRRDARRLGDATRRAEERSALLERETRLAHAARVNSLGELASGIAHELTQPLTALLSQSQAAVRLAGPGGDPARLGAALQANVREARRAGAILGRMREYISNRPVERRPCDLDALVADVAALAGAGLAGQGISLVVEPGTGVPQAVVDPIEIEQVLHNLVRNAADSLAALPEASPRIIAIRTRAARNGAEIEVSDTGPGIPASVMTRLFEPFFTTKSAGMGLGLSLCATLVERVGGRIAAASPPVGGAVFTLWLPPAPARQEAAQ